MIRRFLRRRPTGAGGLDCAQVGELVQSFLDSELDDEMARAVSAHLDECRRCGPEASVYRDLKATLAHRTDPSTESVERLRSFGHELVAGEPGGEDGAPAP